MPLNLYSLPRPQSVRCIPMTVPPDLFLFLHVLSTGMAPEVWLPPFCRPQNVSAALCSSHAVCYRCHAAPLRSQCHGDPGQQHYRVSRPSLKRPVKMPRYGRKAKASCICHLFLLTAGKKEAAFFNEVVF